MEPPDPADPVEPPPADPVELPVDLVDPNPAGLAWMFRMLGSMVIGSMAETSPTCILKNILKRGYYLGL